MQVLGQILGIISFGVAFSVYQMKDKKSMIIMQTILVAVMSAHYFCLGAYPGMAMNLFCIVRNFIYYRKDIFKWRYTPLAVSAVIMLVGILTSGSIWSAFVVAGLTINSYCLSLNNPQHFRMSILVTSPLVLIYNIIVFSIGGVLMETISIISAIIGIARYTKIRGCRLREDSERTELQ